MPVTTRIKICCIMNTEEMFTAVDAGANAVGLVSAMPSGPGVIPESDIAGISGKVPPGIASFLLTSLTDADEIIAQQRRCRTNTLQLVDAVPPEEVRKIRDSLPGIAVIQVLHVIDRSAIDDAVRYSPYVNALLLDSGTPFARTKELGGTGRTHNWEISAELTAAVDVPVFLAGGLNPDNVSEAVRAVKPFGVDVCSGVRTGGKLDPEKVRRFIRTVHETSALI